MVHLPRGSYPALAPARPSKDVGCSVAVGYSQDGRGPAVLDYFVQDLETQDRQVQGAEDSALSEKQHRWVNRRITSAALSGDLAWLLKVIQVHLDRMNLINSSTAVHRIAKLALCSSSQARESLRENEVIKQLQYVVSQHVAQLQKDGLRHDGTVEEGSEMRCLSIICWSCATLRLQQESLFSMAAQVSQSRLAELKPFELSNMLWAFAKLSCDHTALIDGVAPHLLARREGQYSPQCLSTIVWALGTMKVNHGAIFSSFATEIASAAHTMVSQGIANTAWAFARVRRQEAPLFRALAAAACRESVVWTFKPQELSNTVWAFATVGIPHAKLFDRIVEVAISRRYELPPQNVANLLWGYAKLLVLSRSRLFPSLLQIATARLAQYKPQEVSAILWATAKEVGCPVCHGFFRAAAQKFETRLGEFTSQALACMVEAFTLSRVDGGDFFEAMVRESVSRIHNFQPPSLCTLLRGMALKASQTPGKASASGVSDDLLRRVSGHILSRLHEMQPHNLAHLKQTMEWLQPSGKTLPGLQALQSAPVFATLPPSEPPSSYAFTEDCDGSDLKDAGGGRRSRRRQDRRTRGSDVRNGVDSSAHNVVITTLDDEDLEDVGLVPDPPEACLEQSDAAATSHSKQGGFAGRGKGGKSSKGESSANKNGGVDVRWSGNRGDDVTTNVGGHAGSVAKTGNMTASTRDMCGSPPGLALPGSAPATGREDAFLDVRPTPMPRAAAAAYNPVVGSKIESVHSDWVPPHLLRFANNVPAAGFDSSLLDSQGASDFRSFGPLPSTAPAVTESQWWSSMPPVSPGAVPDAFPQPRWQMAPPPGLERDNSGLGASGYQPPVVHSHAIFANSDELQLPPTQLAPPGFRAPPSDVAVELFRL